MRIKPKKAMGVLDVFDRYNFTVKEDEPLEKEVAVDPEMLGKVFENLLEIKDRKSQGTYYTPREIVHYMCQESLTHYLTAELHGKVKEDEIEHLIKNGETTVENDNRVIDKGHETPRYSFKLPEGVRKHAALIDEKLAALRLCDPAVGSGAFVVGMMNEIVKTRKALGTYIEEAEERMPYHLKRHAIQNCLYGVDIEPSAVEIAKLRLWLSLIVDEEKREIIQPLPNLDYKIVQGDALLDVEFKDIFKNVLFGKVERLKLLHFNENSFSKKEELKNQIDDLTGGGKEFDFKLYFSEVFHDEKKGFDLMIGNPPYIQLQKDGGKLGKLYKDTGYQTFTRTGDIYQLFYERGCQVLRPKGGLLAFITSNSWLKAEYGKKTRRYFAEQHTPLRLLEMGDDVFENAMVDASILIVRSGKSDETGRAVDMSQLENKELPPAEHLWAPLRPKGEKPWSVLSVIEQSIMDKMEAAGTPLKDWKVSIYRGVTTGLNDAFIIDNETKKKLIAADPKSAEIIKPVLRGRDIQRYQAKWAGLWLITTFPARQLAIDDYPAIKDHLLSFGQDRLEQSGKPLADGGRSRKKTQHSWFEMQDATTYHEDFEKEKLVWPDISEKGRFAYDDSGIYCEATTFVMTGKYIKYLCALLNAKLIRWCLQRIAPNLGVGALRWKKVYLEAIPIPKITAEKQKPFIRLVDRILKAKAKAPDADTSKLEGEMDRLVYQLYGLTEEEQIFFSKDAGV